MRFTKSRIIATGLFAALGLGLTTWPASASPATATPPYCSPGNTGVDIRGHTLHAAKIKGVWLAQGEIRFYVDCPPISGDLDMRLQMFHPKEDEWRTVGKPTTVNALTMYHGEHFTMRRIESCSGDFSWRIRLWVSPGVAGDGTPTPPETFYYPKRVGKQLDCRG